MFKKTINIIIDLLLFLSLVIVIFLVKSLSLNLLIKILFYICCCVTLFGYLIFKPTKFRRIVKLFLVLYISSVMCVLTYYFMDKFGFLNVFSSVNNLKAYILSTRSKGILVYITIQVLQVVILPVPAAIICIVGSLIYGPLKGAIYCSIGILIGSYISFLLGKTCGYKLVSWIVGKSNTDKYSEIIRKRGGFFLGLAFLLPMFPDDVLCLIAGITNMSSKTFFWVVTLTRPIGVICMSIFGSGHLIPFTGWGIYVWVVILILAIIMVYITYRYQEQMQNFVFKKLFKNRKTTKN